MGDINYALFFSSDDGDLQHRYKSSITACMKFKYALCTFCVSAFCSFGCRYAALPATAIPSPSTADEQLNMLTVCSNFIDHSEWKMEFSNFPATVSSGKERAQGPFLQIWSLKQAFINDDGSPIPCMRIVAFFPHIQPRTLFSLLTDRELRLQWDFNYRYFETFPGRTVMDTKASPNLEALQGELCSSSTTSHQRNDTSLQKEGNNSFLINKGWFTHRVGSEFLNRLGVEDRLFLYYRWCFCHSFPTVSDPRVHMYTVLYDGSRATCERESQEGTNDFLKWRRGNKNDGSKAILSSMNYQHITLLPVADANAQLVGVTGKLHELATTGSFLNPLSNKSLSSFLKDSHMINTNVCGSRNTDGTLFIISSVNDVGLPRLIPQWVQSKLTSAISLKVYGALMNACASFETRDSNPKID